jgi:hypothetical protein
MKTWAVICIIVFCSFGSAVAEPAPTVDRVLQWWSENAEINESAGGIHFHYVITPARVHIDSKAQEVRIDVDTDGGQNIYSFADLK